MPQNFDKFVQNHPLGTIHQLREWGEFQTKTPGRDKFWAIEALDLKGDRPIIASALIIRQSLPFGKCWLYSPRGPLVDYSNKEQTAAIFAKISQIAKEEKAVFFRFDPPLLQDDTNLKKIPKTRTAHAHYQPESTLLIDLTKSEDQILAQMKPKGRYNIKVAQKHGVTVEECTAENLQKNIQEFYNLFTQTTGRDHFSGHPKKFYQDMLEIFDPQKNAAASAKLYLARYNSKPIAGAIVTYFNKTATYYFGASSSEDRNVMAPYLLHWKIMQDAKAAGYETYDLFGIAPTHEAERSAPSKPHPWAGVTEFKLKFGGQRINYAPAREIIYKPFWYWLIRAAKCLRGRQKNNRQIIEINYEAK
ncbi:peptidoglycan bridge formation glycyltransferase FemA/FemB family protein [Patescibacteria group bacterium]|nr:peptidoglycan bridge formation glycyltransferase FemA/FemB family protein [Patescibacteria group bacterium]MBU1953379.1 peptidoglycan bridge formation glycyltransferase FemA/FemB family protein [Patescibacteria group bacterium]